MTTYYANASTGNDSYDGLSATYTTGTHGPKKTFAAIVNTAQAAGNGHTVMLADGTYSGTSVVTISSDITIQGASMTGTIRSMGASARALIVNSGVSLTLKYITIQGGLTSTDNGGAITNNGTLFCRYVKFYDNHASGSGSASIGNGGAVYCSSTATPVTFEYCTFDSNSAYCKGGGVAFGSRSGVIDNCTFTNNTSLNGIDGDPTPGHSGNPAGGAFWAGGSSASNRSTIDVTNSTFTSNGGQYGCGGVAYITLTETTITGCTFNTNYIGGTGTKGDFGNGYGGVFHVFNNKTTITNSSFNGNWCKTGGGAICSDVKGNTVITNCTFTGNYAKKNNDGQYGTGGAIYALDTGDYGNTIKIYGSTFTGNYTDTTTTDVNPSTGAPIEHGGGAIRLLGIDTVISGCTITGNTAQQGGGIRNQGATLKIYDSTITGNTPNDVYPAVTTKSGTKSSVYTAPLTTTDEDSYMCIGPVVLDDAHLFDSSEYSFTNSATKTVYAGGSIVQRGQFDETYKLGLDVTVQQALQLKGVVEQGEIVWMNTSDITDNDYLQHKGYVLLTSLNITEESPQICQCDIEYIKISDYANEYLTMDYSRGLYDGVNIVPSYNVTNTSTIFTETGASTTNWSSARVGYTKRGTPTTKTFTSDGTEFDLTLQCATNASYATTYDYLWTIYNKSGVDISTALPFTLIYDMDYNTLASSSALKSMGVGLCPTNYTGGSGYFNSRRDQFFETYFDITGSTKYGVRTRKGTATTNLVSATSFSSTSNQTVRFKLEFESDAKVRVSIDVGVTGSYSQVYYGASGLTNYSYGLIVYLWIANNSTSSWTGSFRNLTMTRTSTPSFPNLVMMPANAALEDTNVTGDRDVEDGTAYYYANPSTEKRYTTVGSHYYDGSVKLLSTNNYDADSVQVTSIGYKLTPTTTILKNGMTRLVFNANGFDLQAYYSSAWNTINTFVYSDGLGYIKPIYIDSERVVLQLNNSKLTMLRSSPIVTLDHPNSAVNYTLKDSYTTGSGTTTSPSAGTSIDMLLDTDYYMTVYNAAASDYRLLFVKKDPCSIYSDSLPADTKTGIGWVYNSGSGYETAVNQALSWYKQTRTGISLKQIV